MVVLTTIIFGTFMKLAQKCLLGSKPQKHFKDEQKIGEAIPQEADTPAKEGDQGTKRVEPKSFAELRAIHNRSMRLILSTSQVQRGMHGNQMNISALQAMDELHASLALPMQKNENLMAKSNLIQAKNVNMFLSVNNP